MEYNNNINNIFTCKIIYEDNKYYGYIKLSELLKYEIKKPNEQRILDNNKVKDIIHYQENYYNINNKFNFVGLINFHYCKQDNIYYLVDGQHRYTAINELYKKYGEINFMIELIIIDKIEEIKENYYLINKNTELPDLPEDLDFDYKDMIEITSKYFFDKYSKIFNDKSTRRPRINKNRFQESIHILFNKLFISKSSDLINIIENFNDKLKKWNWDDNEIGKEFTNREKVLNICFENKIYLGIFPLSDEYKYGWVKEIIREQTGCNVKEQTKYKKKKIPKSLKDLVWHKHIGKDKGSVKCICCNNYEITMSNFHAGHIIAESVGGLINIDNILPICSTCNLSMGSQNMKVFIKNTFPENIKNFNKRKYIDTKKKKGLMGFM
tara:strand:+ start:1073 stop:2215 length:1143 start_codon:yes stop_codon:yes gene_type:complete